MSAYLTALAGAMTAVGVAAVAVGRNWPGTTGRHRAPRVRGVADDVTLAGLLPPWPQPVVGAAVAQGWRWCPSCTREEPSVLHTDGTWQCGHCLDVSGGAA